MRVWLCHGRSGVLRDTSSSLCEARSHPFARPSCSYPLYPEKKTSLPAESSFRRTTQRSRSLDSDALTQSFSRMLPISSTTCSNRREKTALVFGLAGRYCTLPLEATGSLCRLPVFAQRYSGADCTDEGGQLSSLRTS